MDSPKLSIRALGVCGVAFLLMGFGWWGWWGGWQPFHWQYPIRWYPRWHAPNPQPPVYCTQDVMQCPDGSYVGRVPPTCAFKACPASAAGVVSGQAFIGPLCPVEPCSYPRPNPYVGRMIILTPQTANVPVAYIPLSPDGKFRRTVRAGTYTLALSPCAELGCRTALPKTIVVPPNGEVQATIDIDTGIR